MTDATDRSRREATHRQLCAITAPFEQDALDVMVDIADRLAKGRDQYGDLQIDRDPRDFDAEADEEALDFLIYRAAERIRRRRRERAAMLADLARFEVAERAKLGLDTWSTSIGVNPEAAAPITGPVLCTCAECVENRANAARLGHAVAPATFHAVEPAVARTTTPQVDAPLGAMAEITGVEDSAPLAVECEKSRAITVGGEGE